MDDTPHQPHDKLFKHSFKDPVTAAAFLRQQFPGALVDAIDWNRLKLRPGTFIDSHFRASESDLLFSTTLSGKPTKIYFLFEHQRTPDPLLILRPAGDESRTLQRSARRPSVG